MTDTRRALIAELNEIQNQISAPIDIMTITGLMNEAELRKHLDHYRAKYPAAA